MPGTDRLRQSGTRLGIAPAFSAIRMARVALQPAVTKPALRAIAPTKLSTSGIPTGKKT